MFGHLSRDVELIYDDAKERKVVCLDSSEDTLPMDRIQDYDLRLIGKAWMEMPRLEGERLPRWSNFSPADFRSMIEKLCVLSVEDWRAGRLEFTLYGNHPTELIGLGRPLRMMELREDAARKGNYEDIRKRAGRAIEMCAPQYARKNLSWNDHGYIEYEVLMLPFMREAGAQRILQPVAAMLNISGQSSDKAHYN